MINIIGLLAGPDANSKAGILDALKHMCTFRGVFVGSREQMEDMVRAIEVKNIKPVVDKEVFPLETAREAYEYMLAQRHFGKIAISID